MLTEIAQAEPGISSDLLHKIYGPAGLNIGADTPEEIALSIVAEIQSVIAHKEAGFLKHKTGPIHSGANHTFDPVIIA
jgi:xanthine/CO dehydrogenase XdhC/CoxF family maturation factor